MKTKIYLLLTLLYIVGGLRAALAPARLSFQVIDETGSPVGGALVRAGTFSHHVPGDAFGEDKTRVVSGATGNDGRVTLECGSLTGEFRYNTEKAGYYADHGGTYRFSTKDMLQWKPWNPTNVIFLKPIVNPIPLYGKRVDLLPIPAQDTAIGYDLMAGDWVTPRGRGTNADVFFNFHRQFTNVALPFDLSVDITFPNDGDGLLAANTAYRQGSILRLRTAPETGYTNALTRRIFRATASTPINSGTDENRNYFLRVRTQQSNGQITSALYGKIYGDIALSAFGKLRFTYYLNSTPKSHNLEFDTRSNLLIKLASFEKPGEP